MANNSSSAVLDPTADQPGKNEEDKVVMVILPTYNEVENMPRLLDTLFGLGITNLQVTLVDDNSPDGTADLVEKIGQEKYPGRIFIIRRPGKMGLGTAYIQGFEFALSKNADYIVQMDSDFSHDPKVIKQFLERIPEADVVIGSRYVAGGAVDKRWKLIRKVISRFGSFYSRLILGLKINDTTGGFRMFRRQVLEALPLDKVRSNGYCFQVEMAYLIQKQGFKSSEVPIYFSERVAGVSKMSLAIAFEAAWKVWQIRFRY